MRRFEKVRKWKFSGAVVMFLLLLMIVNWLIKIKLPNLFSMYYTRGKHA